MLKPHLTPEKKSYLQKITQVLLEEGYSIHLKEKNELVPQAIIHQSEEDLFASCDEICVLGGDGTLLRFLRNITAPFAKKIYSIHLGSLGFLTQFPPEDFIHQFAKISQYQETLPIKRYTFALKRQGKIIKKGVFINDVVIKNNQISRVIENTVVVEGQNLYHLKGDGIILSSPLGSTAYSLAAGGPIVHPAVSSFVVNPICPHATHYRPLIIPDKMPLEIIIPPQEQEATLTIDGQENISLEHRDIISVYQEKNQNVFIIKAQDYSYFSTLKEKFKLGSS